MVGFSFRSLWDRRDMRLHLLPLFLALSCAGSHRTTTCPPPVFVTPPLAVMGPIDPVDATVAAEPSSVPATDGGTTRPTRSRVSLAVLCQRMDAGVTPPDPEEEVEEINPEEVVPLINRAMAVVDRVLDGGAMDVSPVRHQTLLAAPTPGDQSSSQVEDAPPVVDASFADVALVQDADASVPADNGHRSRHRHRRRHH